MIQHRRARPVAPVLPVPTVPTVHLVALAVRDPMALVAPADLQVQPARPDHPARLDLLARLVMPAHPDL